MTKLVGVSQSGAGMVSGEPYLGQVERPMSPLHVDGLLVKIARRIEIFSDWLSGPPMSSLDRHNLKTGEAQRRRSCEIIAFTLR